MAFFRGREGRQIPKTRLTLARDQSFTMLLISLEELRPLLRAAYRKTPEALARIDGTFWKNLERLSRPRKKRKKEEA